MEKLEPASRIAAPLSRGGRIVAVLCWIYAILMIAVWLFLRIEGDRSWVGAVAIFSPRWVFLLPLALLVPLSVAFNRRSLWILAVAGMGATFWVAGLCLPWRTLISRGSPGITVRVLTCNVHRSALHPRELADLIGEVNPDIIVLQEWFPPYESPVLSGGWNIVTSGEQLLATRYRIDAAADIQNANAVRYTLETAAGRIELFNVHLASPHPPLRAVLLGLPGGKADLEKNIIEREGEARELNRISQGISSPLLIAGDFNLCPDSPIFRDNFGNLGDAFESAGLGFGWTYRVKWTAARIDHILSNSRWSCRECWVGVDVGSPHRPLIADYSILTGQ